jgi:hypothetical protein
MTNYLRFPDETTFQDAAEAAGFYQLPEGDNPGGYIQYTHDYAMDIIGTIYNNDAVIDGETGEITSPATSIVGFHINFVGELPTGWDEFLVSPVHPHRVFG